MRLSIRFPSRRKLLRLIREGVVDAPREASRIARMMLAQRCSWRMATELTRARDRIGYTPDLRNPRSFNEKLIHRKLFAPPSNAAVLADKLAVREHVRRVVGEQYLVPLHAVYESADQIELARLPKSFVIKANHATGRNVIVTDRDAVDPEALRRTCRTFLAEGFGAASNERWYCGMPRRLMVEELIVEEGLALPLDYKFFVFHGRTEFIQVDFDRYIDHTRTLYTPRWQRMDVTYGKPPGPNIDKPAMLDELMEVAARLAGDIDFVRIDLYSPANLGRIYFGEYTFAPLAGWGRFGPTTDVDFRIGELWKLRPREPSR